MSCHTWTADALKSNLKPIDGICWRVVEAQNKVSSLKLVDTLDEQQRLEELLEETKPEFPPELKHHDFLLFTPFRYVPYEHGSRFRRQGQRDGVFYGSEQVETAMAEIAFYRFLFFKESPDIDIPDNAPEYTAFTVKYGTDKALYLTKRPLSDNEDAWMDKESYEACQFLADEARKVECEVIISHSIRCPQNGKNISLISWRAFRSTAPESQQTWRMAIKETEIVAVSDFPRQSLKFSRSDFEDDPRIKALSS
jgi:hypothetical protein